LGYWQIQLVKVAPRPVHDEQEDFSWKGVALAAIGGAVSGGLGASGAFSGLGAAGSVITRAVVGNALTQGIAVVTGLQAKFDWKGVAAAAVGAGVSYGMSEALGVTSNGERTADFKAADLGERLFKSSLVGFSAGVATAAARGGRVSITQVATDAFGNALGESFKDSLVSAGQQEMALAARSENQREANRFASGRMANETIANNALALRSRSLATDEMLATDTQAPPRLPASLAMAEQNVNDQIVAMETQEYRDRPMYASLSLDGVGVPDERDFKQSDFLNKLKLKEVSQFLAETRKTLGGWTDDSNAVAAAFEDYYKNQAKDPNNGFLVQSSGQALALAVSSVGANGIFNPMEMARDAVASAEHGVESKVGLEELKKLGGVGPDNDGVRKGLGKIIETQLKFTDTVVQGLGKRFGLGKILDKLVDGSSSFRGTIGELMTENALRMTGLFSEVAGSLSDKSWGIKNTSDNDIDIIAKPKFGAYAAKGGWYGYEVKASQNGSPQTLSEHQKRGADSFMRKRIDDLVAGDGVFTIGRVSQSDVAMAKRIQSEQGRMEYRGDVVQITNFGGKDVKVNITPWVPPALKFTGRK
jgi:hypothetical protein